MNKTISYITFAIGTVFVVLLFLTSKSYYQLTAGMLLYVPLVYFAFKIFPRKKFAVPEVQVQSPIPQQMVQNVAIQKEETGHVGIADIDKRAFLKLIGGAGVALFLYSIFNKKAEGLFFGKTAAVPATVSLEDTNGNKIDPAEHQPTDGYRISEIDDNVVTFYGFTNKQGAWFIMREDTEGGSFRYIKGDGGFPSVWPSRENLKYDYYDNIF